jgi:nucleotide-binding universal stress UspA family protein
MGTATMAFRTILVALDGSPHAQRGLDVAVEMSRCFHAALLLVAVAPLPVVAAAAEPWIPPQLPTSDVKHYREVLDRAKSSVEGQGPTGVRTVCLEGHPAEELLALTDKEKPDLVVVGSRGLSTARRILLGSVSDALVHHARCPVLVVRPPEESRGG